MSDLIQTLRESDAELLKAEAADLAKWSKLKHVKQDFELFLQFNIAHVSFTTVDGKEDSIICTSNTALLKVMNEKDPEKKQKLAKFRGSGIKTKDMHFVKTWDLVDKTYKMVSLKSWQIDNFISITPDNVLILDELLNNLL